MRDTIEAIVDSWKSNVISAFIAQFQKELEALILSAKAAHLAATHEESRAEDRHDTFAIESSYLAAGQAKRVQDIRKSINELTALLESQNSKISRTVDVGSLITLATGGKETYSLITRLGGGAAVLINEKSISLVTPTSPLGDSLMGLAQGDDFTIETKNGLKTHLIVSLQ